mmetsp:Transcript_18216/g.42488  ORF Transcript_18216/g.42488 Transcript_18216/m.42488 type:complete len:921 (-) Transcript_18216:21-2783(-)
MADDKRSSRGQKAKEISRCLGYLHSTSDADYLELVGDLLSSLLDKLAESDTNNDEAAVPECVSLWELRTLAIQPEGLLSQPNRRSAWLKLCGGDGELFDKYNGRFFSPSGQGYEEIRRSIESVMAPSRWHISKERRRLRKAVLLGYNRPSSSSNISVSSGQQQHPSSTGTHSDGSSTPLTANGWHSMAGTPRSCTFSTCSSLRGAPFGSLSSATVSFKSLTINTDPPLDNDDSSSIAPSPLSHTSNPCVILKSKTHFNMPQNGLRKPKAIRIRGRRKDRRPQERKLIIQIATSAFYLLQCDPEINASNFHSYAGLQDLIAVLLLNMESPSLTSFTLKQILKGHLHTYCSSSEGHDDEDSYASCLEDVDDIDECCDIERRCFHALSFFPILQAIDSDLHSAATKLEKGSDLVDEVILPVAYVVERWISNWLCSLDTLPVSLISRLVDFFLSSHPATPLYLVMAIVTHPINRQKFLSGSSSNSSSPRNVADIDIAEEPTFLEKLERMFIELPQETVLSTASKQTDFANEDLDSNSITSQDTADYESSGELLANFMEEAIVISMSIMKTVPPQSLDSLTREYQEQCLVAHLPRVCDPTRIPDWSKRITTRTDYDVIQGVQSTGVVRFCEDERFSCAYDASGLEVNEIYSEIPRDWPAIKMNAIAPKLFAYGLIFCLVAVILQNQRGDFSGNRNLIGGSTKGGLNYDDGTTTATAIDTMATSVGEPNQLPPKKIIPALKSSAAPRNKAKTTSLPTTEKLENKDDHATKLQNSKTKLEDKGEHATKLQNSKTDSLGANKFVAEDLFALRPKVKSPQPRHPQPPKEFLISSDAFHDPPREERDDQPLLGDEPRGVKVGCGPRIRKGATSKKKRDKSQAYQSVQVAATPTKKKNRFGRIVNRAAKSLRVLRKEYEALVDNDDYILLL